MLEAGCILAVVAVDILAAVGILAVAGIPVVVDIPVVVGILAVVDIPVVQDLWEADSLVLNPVSLTQWDQVDNLGPLQDILNK